MGWLAENLGPMFSDTLRLLVEGQSLDEASAQRAMEYIMSGQATPVQITSFLVAMRMKGETVDELVGCARAMREAVVPVKPKRRPLLDTCGTGGDARGTMNISTLAAFVVAGAGTTVAKHGNRSISSQCGSADLLEALGLSLELGPKEVAKCIDHCGIGFMFAPRFHPAMKRVATVRRELGFRTIFNLLGPLTNPASVEHHMMGVYSSRWCKPMAQVMHRLGVKSALVVHGHDGLDEISVSGPTRGVLLRDGHLKSVGIDPARLGLPLYPLSELSGGNPADNARQARALLSGKRDGALRAAVLLNAGAALLAAGAAENMRDGFERARQSLDSGAARERLEALVSFC